MADQWPFSRFRLPWVTATPRPPTEPQPPRPAIETQAPAQPTSTIPRRPFRPGLPSVQAPPPQDPAPQPTLADTQSKVSVQPASLSGVPPSPTRAKSSQTRSPSRTAPQPRAASLPPSPTGTTYQSAQQTVPQPQASPRSSSQLVMRPSLQSSPTSRRTAELNLTGSQPTSPANKSQSTTAKEISQPPPIPKQVPPLAYQQEPKSVGSLLFSQASQPTTRFKPLSEPAEKEKENEEGNKIGDKLNKGNRNGPSEEPVRNAITELLTGSKVGSQIREQKQQEKEDKKKTTIGSREEHIKTVSSTHPKARNRSTESQQKPSMTNGEQIPLHKEIRDDISKFVHKLGIGQLKYPIDERPVSVVTIAGENTGASMHVGTEPARKDGSIHIHRGYKLNPDDSTGATTDGEGSTAGRSKNPTKEDPVEKAYVNSNTQSINSSIILDSSVNEQNPGVHLALSHNLAEPNKPSGKPYPLETHKSEFNVTPSEKLTYEPTIRRRCLRGLFLEPSDSDNDNPEKPRRHGCLYACGKKSRDKDIGVL